MTRPLGASAVQLLWHCWSLACQRRSLRAQVRMLELAAEAAAMRVATGGVSMTATVRDPLHSVPAPAPPKAKPQQKPKASSRAVKLSVAEAAATVPHSGVESEPTAALAVPLNEVPLVVDISAPYVPPPPESDSDELMMPDQRRSPPMAKPARAAPPLPLAPACHEPSLPMPSENAAGKAPPAVQLAAPASVRSAFAALHVNAPAMAKEQGGVAPKKRKLGTGGPIDAMPPAFLLSMMGARPSGPLASPFNSQRAQVALPLPSSPGKTHDLHRALIK